MQTFNTDTRTATTSRARWIVPPAQVSAKTTDDQKKRRALQSVNTQNVQGTYIDNPNYSRSNSHNDSGFSETSARSRDEDKDSSRALDLSTCKTLSIFIREHLKELREHQQSISQARSNMANFSNDGKYISRHDIPKLRVRDQQIRAIETIQQLTNYLREISLLMREKYTEFAKDSVCEEIFTTMEELRSEIIYSLNDFVLSNNDIDVPIIDLDDIQKSDYDLCIDAHSKALAEMSDSFADNVENIERRQYRTASCSMDDEHVIVISHENTPDERGVGRQALQQADLAINEQSLDTRRKEIEKLQRDTLELRRLFSDFYELVKIQGEQLSTIEDNIVIAARHIGDGQQNLHRTVRNLNVIIPVTGCMAGAIIGGPVGLALGGKIGAISMLCGASLLGLMSSYGAQRCITGNNSNNNNMLSGTAARTAQQ